MNAIAIHAFNPGPMTGDGNWTWLIPGRVPTLVDAGVGDPRHLVALERQLGGARLSQVLITHGHPDHASGVPALASRMPGVRFLRWGQLSDGQRIDVGDESLVVVHTPGHAPDHLCFWHEPTRTLFGGDLALQGTTVWIPASAGGDVGAYIASLEKVLALEPARILPAHGPAIDDPTALLRYYIDHRRERERQITDVLRGGDLRAEEIVSRIYTDLPLVLVRRAVETATAHLQKLERDGVVRRTADAWHIITGRSDQV